MSAEVSKLTGQVLDPGADALRALADKHKREIVMLDVSGSMQASFKGSTETRISAAKALLRAAAERRAKIGPLFALHTFSCSVNKVRQHAEPLSAMLRDIDHLETEGSTRLRVAIVSGLTDLKLNPSPASINHLLLVTDAEDAYSIGAAVEDALAARASSVVVDIILIQPDARACVASMECLAHNTGGRFVRVDDVAGLTSAMEELTTRSLLLLED